MKKTLITLALTTFLANSASAITLYQSQDYKEGETGTKIKFSGSIRLLLERTKEDDEYNTLLRNKSSRMKLKIRHELGDEYYALGYFKFKFDQNAGDDDFGDPRVSSMYVGIGNENYGQFTFGSQDTIADDVGLATDYAYGLNPGYVVDSGDQVIRYDYEGIDNLQLSVSYNLAEEDEFDDDNQLEDGLIDNAVVVGGLYEWEINDDQSAAFQFAYGHENYKSPENSYQDGFMFSAGYTVNDVTLSLDSGLFKAKNAEYDKGFFVYPSVKVPLIEDKVDLYGSYLYERKEAGDVKEKTQGGFVGVSYQPHENVITYVEGFYSKTKFTENGEDAGSEKEKAIGVGMRVYW